MLSGYQDLRPKVLNKISRSIVDFVPGSRHDERHAHSPIE
jgi:hypothetical protein